MVPRPRTHRPIPQLRLGCWQPSCTPRRRREVVRRPRLTDRVVLGDQPALTLVSAPAGFGKTTLLTEWLGRADLRRPRRLAVPRSRRQRPAVFWSYVVAALQIGRPGRRGDRGNRCCTRPQPLQAVSASLLNDLDGSTATSLLVLDDYHVIDVAPTSTRPWRFLLEHLPAQLHLVLGHPLRPAAAAGAAAGPRRARSRSAPPTCASPPTRRRRYLNDSMGLRPDRGRRRRPRSADRGLDRRAPARRAVDAGPRRRQRVHRRLRRRRPLRRRLPRRGGARPPARADVRDFLLADLDPRPAHRPLCDAVTGASRRPSDARTRSSGPTCSSSRSTTGGAGTATTTCSPTCSEHAARRRPRPGRRTAPASQRVVRRQRRPRGRHRTRAGRSRISTDAARLIELAAPAMRKRRQEGTLRRWLEALPPDVFRDRPVLAMSLVERGCPRATRRASSHCCCSWSHRCTAQVLRRSSSTSSSSTISRPRS